MKRITKEYISILRRNSLEFRLKKVNETRNYLIEKIKHNDLVSEKYKKICKYLRVRKTLAYFSFNSYWLCFDFCIWFISSSSCLYYEFCIRIKNF